MSILPNAVQGSKKDNTSKIDLESVRRKFNLMTLECGRYEVIDYSVSIKIDNVQYNVLSFMIDCGLPNDSDSTRSLTLVLLKANDEGVSPVLYNYFHDINTYEVGVAVKNFSLLKL